MKNRKHYHELEKPCKRVRVLLHGRILAETCDAVVLKEVGKKIYDPVFYIPKEDVRMDLLECSDTVAKCLIKGKATYWNYVNEKKINKDIAWSYENPIEYSRPIKERIAFDTNKITLELSPY